MDKEYEHLLRSGLLSPPPDFAERVMREVGSAPLPAKREWTERLQWLALLGGAVLGALQLAGFILGVWTATSAS